MTQPIYHWRDTVRAVLTFEGQVLLVQHNHMRPEYQGSWGLPGGAVESVDASLEATLLRELHEECRIEVQIGRKLGAWPQQREGHTRYHHVFHVMASTPNIIRDASELIAAVWYQPDAVNALWTTLGWEPDAIRLAFAPE
ncbi:MAG: NUDIX domain-containing protein [Anaerolineaceae bacterium]|nr:NUDIX domain-containing protein [Anaerolineaceae bacterium]